MNNIEISELKKYNMDLKSCTDEEINGIKNEISRRLKKASSMLNLEKDVFDSRDFKLTEDVFSKTSFKKNVDWTNTMSSIKNQGKLGSCVGFAVAAMKEWQEQQEHEREVAEGKKYRRKQDHYDLSEAWIYWNCKKIDSWPRSEGTSIRCAMQVLHKMGVPCEKAYPYSDKYKGKPESWAKLVARWGLIGSYWRCKGLDDLRLALQNGPVVIGILCFREMFFVGKNGKISYPSNSNEILGGHAVCAVGFNDRKKLIKFKNSWGKKWGKNGYGYISYKYVNNCMLDAWVAKDLSVTRKILNERE